MPNWKKVIVSGSNASLNSLIVNNGVTSSLLGTASYADNAGLLNNTSSGVFATTGSNIFKGSQTIHGNLFMSGSFPLVYNNDTTNNMLFGMFDGSNIYGPYYQLFGNQYSNISQRGGAEFVYDIRNNADANFHISSFNGSNWFQKFMVNDTGVQITGSLQVTGGITGSLYGTSSWAINALTASSAQNASDILVYVQNNSGAQIDKGKVVRISGAVGDNPQISLADWTNDANSANTLGLVTENIANGGNGYVLTEGRFIGYDTSTPGWTAGQVLYLASSGSITGSAPQAPLHGVRLGQVLRVQLNNGSIYVSVDNGYELGELHDVVDTTTTSSYGDLLVKSGSVWHNSKQLTGSYGLTGSLTITGGTLVGSSSYALTSSYASNAELLDGRDSLTFANTSSNTFTGTQYISDTTNATSFSSTAALYTDGGLRVTKDTYISSSLYVNGNFTVFGTASITYITSSVFIGGNRISLNTDAPAIRFAGIDVYDSGSNVGVTGSLLWDSLNNRWVYANPSGSTYDGGMLISGPRNTNGLGNEQGTINNRVTKGQGGDHITSSQITDDGTTVSIPGNLTVTGSITGLINSASYALTSSNILGGAQYYVPFFNTNTTVSSSFLYQSGSLLKTRFGGNDLGLSLDFANNQYKLGDTTNDVGIGVYDGATKYTAIGDYNYSYNGTSLFVDETNQIIRTSFQSNNDGLKIDFGNLVYSLGDVNNTSNGTKITVDNFNSRIDLSKNTYITGSLYLSSSLYSAQGRSAGVGTTVIATISTGSYRAGFFDYTVYNTGNARAGTVASAWNGSSVTYTDTSTTDIGATNSVTMSVALNGGNVELRTTAGTTWTVQSTYRLI